MQLRKTKAATIRDISNARLSKSELFSDSSFLRRAEKYLASYFPSSDRNDIADVLQESITIFLEKAPEQVKRSPAKSGKYILVTAKRLLFHSIRGKHSQASRIESFDEDFSLIYDVIRAQSVKSSIDELELRLTLDALIQKLSRYQAETLLYHYYADLSFEEISKLHGCSLNAVKKRHQRALTNLKMLIVK